jgi:carbamoyltransferase
MNILGLNAYHADAAACVMVDGRLIAAAEEERFRRIKHWAGLPTDAVAYCLHEARLVLQDIDHIAINRDPAANLFRKALYTFSRHPGLSTIRDRLHNAGKIRDVIAELERACHVPAGAVRAELHHVEHHAAHLASSYLVSPFDSAAIVSIDGFGDFVSGMIGYGEGSKIAVLDRVTFPHSLGMFYLALTQYLGFHSYGDEYKVMGLAAYGQPEYLDAMQRIVCLKPKGVFQLNLEYFHHHSAGVAMSWEKGAPLIGRVFSDELVRLLGPARQPQDPITTRHESLAASLQAMYESAFFHVLNDLSERTPYKDLCVGGGCAQNSVANGRIASRTAFERVYVPPATGDAGGAIGAAYHIWHEHLGRPRSFVMDRADWGPEWSDAQVATELAKKESELSAAGCRIERIPDDDALSARAALEISRGTVVGWFQGRMEWGPRALGQRSIVADPRRAGIRDVLSLRIKNREGFRPFAPSVLEEAAADYFETGALSPFMSMTYRVKPEKRRIIPAVVHVDGTGRLQTVNRQRHPLYWHLIKEFERLTGIPVLLNTSFNEDEPIVCTPGEALDCFLRTRMGALAIGPFLITRDERPNPCGEFL